MFIYYYTNATKANRIFIVYTEYRVNNSAETEKRYFLFLSINEGRMSVMWSTAS